MISILSSTVLKSQRLLRNNIKKSLAIPSLSVNLNKFGVRYDSSLLYHHSTPIAYFSSSPDLNKRNFNSHDDTSSISDKGKGRKEKIKDSAKSVLSMTKAYGPVFIGFYLSLYLMHLLSV